jgi:uncharacterized protein
LRFFAATEGQNRPCPVTSGAEALFFLRRVGQPKGNTMKTLNLVTLLLVIVGGLNWLLVGALQFDLVAALFGGSDAALSRVIYILVGLSALWQLVPFSKAFSIGEIPAERAR